jgi:hypothetical protein
MDYKWGFGNEKKVRLGVLEAMRMQCDLTASHRAPTRTRPHIQHLVP